MDSVIVACGLAVRDGKVFMQLRRSDAKRPAMWEYPGGKVEPGEDERAALAREWREELGVEAEAGRLVSVASYTWDARVMLLLYRVLFTGTPQALEGQAGIGWFDVVHAMEHATMAPSSYQFYPDVLEHVRRSRTAS